MSEAPNDKTTRGVVDILVYATARLLLVVAVSAAIFGVARLIGLTEFPVVVATLFGLIIAMPLGIWVFSPLRRRATAALAVAGERRIGHVPAARRRCGRPAAAEERAISPE